MKNKLDYNYFDNAYDSRDYRRRQPQRRQSNYNRDIYSSRSKKRKRFRRRTKFRIIIVLIGILILAAVVFLLVTAFKGCTSGQSNTAASVSTETTSATSSAPDEPAQTAAPSVNPTDPLSPSYFITPQIEDDGTSGYLTYGTYVWHNTAFELFGASEDRARAYADAINSYKSALGKDITVYDMVIPNHTEMGLPQRIRESETSATSQAENIGQIYSFLDSTVKPINAYNAIAQHNGEYVYFKSDHHWSGLGAYYAYTAFAQATNQDALDLSKCTEKKVEGFTGSFAQSIDGLESDTVSYWEFPYDVNMTVTYDDGTTGTYDSPYYQYAESGANTYGVFIIGDHSLTVLNSSCEKASDKKIAVVKESYGNAFVPFLTYNYSQVHVVDFRYFEQNFADYCKTNGIDEVLFINGVMSANTQIQIDAMDSLF